MDAIEAIQILPTLKDALDQLEIIQKVSSYSKTANLADDVSQECSLIRELIELCIANLTEENFFEKINSFTEERNIIHSRNVIKVENNEEKVISDLTNKIKTVKWDKKAHEIKKREVLAYLNDQFWTSKRKFSVDLENFSKACQNNLSMNSKKSVVKQNILKAQLTDWKIKLEDECRVNTEMESFLRSCIRKCEDLLKSWKEKYGNDLAKKTLKLNELKTLRKDDMVKFNNLRHTYWEYEKVVVEDKHKKEMAKLEKERENEKLEAVLKIQSWWKGIMVRRCLGQYKKNRKHKKSSKGKNHKYK